MAIKERSSRKGKFFFPVKPGTYHYISPPDDPRNFRLHLRVEQDGSGLMIINASTVLHLNSTAVLFAINYIEGKTAETVGKELAEHFNVSPDNAAKDYLGFSDSIQRLADTPDLDPVTYLGADRVTPFTGQISAPYRLD